MCVGAPPQSFWGRSLEQGIDGVSPTEVGHTSVKENLGVERPATSQGGKKLRGDNGLAS